MSCSFKLLLLLAAVAVSYAVDVEVLNEGLTNGSLILPNGTRAGRSFLTDLLRHTRLPFVVREIGMIECMGADHFFGGNFFETLLGPGNDFGGNFICQPTCGGECIPNQDIGIAPISLYPFGCRCSPNRCNQEGPIITDLPTGIFKVVCVRDTRCSCQGMGPGHSIGYLCNWLNLKSHRIVSFLDRPPRPDINPTYSPIRWCSCCEQPHPAPYHE
ncbi:unnamed protein product [Orchesella dallaii]|uniref:Uncharacterized protein n=1 Tax=Orchesella dallaii TaxID=48710 RepID=A0ABP1R0V9_9HEXA